jgi:hypothetical protein
MTKRKFLEGCVGVGIVIITIAAIAPFFGLITDPRGFDLWRIYWKEFISVSLVFAFLDYVLLMTGDRLLFGSWSWKIGKRK